MVYMDMPGSFILFQTREKMPQLNYVMLKKEKEKKTFSFNATDWNKN